MTIKSLNALKAYTGFGKIDLNLLDSPDDNGKTHAEQIIFAISDEDGALNNPSVYQEYGLGFCCGPEDHGRLNEQDSAYDELGKLFADLTIETGRSENEHAIPYQENLTAKELWELIKFRLEAHGAFHQKSFDLFEDTSV